MQLLGVIDVSKKPVSFAGVEFTTECFIDVMWYKKTVFHAEKKILLDGNVACNRHVNL